LKIRKTSLFSGGKGKGNGFKKLSGKGKCGKGSGAVGCIVLLGYHGAIRSNAA
jgi:hypothetical protein